MTCPKWVISNSFKWIDKMNIKSNICIPSNIYIRNNKEISSDAEFVKHIHGYEALKKVAPSLSGTLSAARLSSIQQQELLEGTSCSLAKNGEITHGKVMIDGKPRWVCRCEYRKCDRFSSCVGQNRHSLIAREQSVDISLTPTVIEPSTEYFEYLGILSSDVVLQTTTPYQQSQLDDFELFENAEIINCEETTPQENINEQQCGFIKIADPTEIIVSDIDSRILVNAGPGTGKTYTVINRLLHIIKNELATPDLILVLCYSRAAVSVIKQRVEAGVKNGELPIEANTVSICTFDWFATRYLAEINADMSTLTHNERIALFNQKIKYEDFDHFKYLIIDEIQDLVNERALMVLNILNNINCGYLLLGDRCQAIYDYDCGTDKSIKSTEFYRRLMDFLGDKALKYELTQNKRQNKVLSKFTDDIRQALLTFDVKSQNEWTAAAMSEIQVFSEYAERFIPQIKVGEKTAVLCRSNGEAEMISSHFCKNNIEHTLLRGAGHKQKLHRFIADIFWDYVEPQITEECFVERYKVRVCDTPDMARVAFSELCKLTEDDNGIIKMSELVSALSKIVDIADVLSAERNTDLVVSTIHRAKGREFENVYILQTSFPESETDAEESRVRYVSVTRPKQNLMLLTKKEKYWNTRITKDRTRSYQIRRPYYNKWYCCSGIALGNDGDVDDTSFVSAILFDDFYETQKYISEKVFRNDKLEIQRHFSTDRYLIYHDGRLLGALASDINQKFWDVINSTCNKNNIPSRLTDVYVNDIVTIVQPRFDESIPLMYRRSKIWLGLSISGLAKVDFN